MKNEKLWTTKYVLVVVINAINGLALYISNPIMTKYLVSKGMMFEYTGVDAIMIGRGALGNPWLIKQLVTYFDTGIILEKPSYKEIIDMCRKHLNYLLELKSEKISVLEMRSHISWYIKGLPKSTEIKKELFTISDAKGIIDLLDRYQDILDNEGI